MKLHPELTNGNQPHTDENQTIHIYTAFIFESNKSMRDLTLDYKVGRVHGSVILTRTLRRLANV